MVITIVHQGGHIVGGPRLHGGDGHHVAGGSNASGDGNDKTGVAKQSQAEQQAIGMVVMALVKQGPSSTGWPSWSRGSNADAACDITIP